jgi:hypothetical protein
LSFTDDDLKRLKERLNQDFAGNFPSTEWKTSELIALLARLEAAEAVCREFKKFEDEPRVCTIDGEAWLLNRRMYKDLLLVFMDWRKAAGK